MGVLNDNFKIELSDTEGVGDVDMLAMIPKKKRSDNIESTMEDKKKPSMEPNTTLQNFLLPDSRLGGLAPFI